MLFHRVSLLTLGLVISFNLQAQIIILPDQSTPVNETPSDQYNEVPKPRVQVVNPRNKPKPAQPVAEEQKPEPAPAKKKIEPRFFHTGF